MILTVHYSNQFRKDLRRVAKQGKDIEEISKIINLLVNNNILEAKHKDHPLMGKYIEHRECHIQADWLLIYRIIGSELVMVRTGSHRELFR